MSDALVDAVSGLVAKGLLKAFEDTSDRCRESAIQILTRLIEVINTCPTV